MWVSFCGAVAQALIQYVQMNKAKDNDWFQLAPANPEGTSWKGKCWYIYNLLRYEFDLRFDIPVTYPSTAPELELPELDGKTSKVHRETEQEECSPTG